MAFHVKGVICIYSTFVPEAVKVVQPANELKTKDLEKESLAEGRPRVKFGAHWKGTIESMGLDTQSTEKLQELVTGIADVMWELEEAGVTPVAPDGKVGGNVSARFTAVTSSGDDVTCLLVSKSGKAAHKRISGKDMCLLEGFDREKWSTDYRAASAEVLPTSDTPLHQACMDAHRRFSWTEAPGIILHGHALETVEEATKLSLPISTVETLFSTPEDSEALLDLLAEHPYPESKVFIRKGHGFMLLGKDLEDALETFREKIKPHVGK